MKIKSKYRAIIHIFLSAFCMSLFMSFVIVSINFGYNDAFLVQWLKIWPQALVCGVIGSLFLPKIVHKAMSNIKFVESHSLTKKE